MTSTFTSGVVFGIMFGGIVIMLLAYMVSQLFGGCEHKWKFVAKNEDGMLFVCPKCDEIKIVPLDRSM